MRLARNLLLASTLLSASYAPAFADVNVVASIKPVHSLVSAVMEGVGQPKLIVDGASTPHSFAMKPSQAQMIQNAELVFWVGHELEAFLEKPLETVGSKAKSVELIDAHNLIKLGFREGGAFEKHDHDDHDDHNEAKADKDHDDHDHEKEEAAKVEDHDDHDHDHKKKKKAAVEKHDDHDHDKKEASKSDDHDDHAHGKFDAHIWLDPKNAKAMVHEIEEALVEADPKNAAKYEANAKAVMNKLDALIAEVSDQLKPVNDKGYIVFHDAYQYFENRFNISASGSITVSPDVMPGAARMTEIRARVKQIGASCVFAEPQFEPKLVTTVTAGTQAKSGVIDPLGSSLENGPDLYFGLIRNMATSIKTCLSEAS